jgi:hypothetical protein
MLSLIATNATVTVPVTASSVVRISFLSFRRHFLSLYHICDLVVDEGDHIRGYIIPFLPGGTIVQRKELRAK